MDLVLRDRPESRYGSGPLCQDGFTLIEVLVALVIVTVTLTSIYKLQASSLSMTTSSRFYTLAPLLAESKLAQIERDGIENAGGSDTFGSEYPGYAWSVQVEPMDSELLKSPNYHMAKIDLTITLNDAMTYEMRTYRFYVDEQ